MIQPEPAFGIVADDLTGANDTLVQFAEAGFLAHLSLAENGEANVASSVFPTALALVTDARALDPASAHSRTRDFVNHLARAGINQLYIKIDSTMRGSVAGQIVGALEAWRTVHPNPFTVVCPAYPAMGRVVREGRLLVHGAPVELSPAGTDPVTPVRTSAMRNLLPGAVLVPPLSSLPLEDRAQALRSAAAESAVVVVDAETQSDLDVLAAVLAEIGPQAVPVGSAGLASAIAARWAAEGTTDAPREARDAGGTLVVVTSLHEVSREQAHVLTESTPPQEILVLCPELEHLRSTPAARAWLEAALPPHALPPTVMVVSPSRTAAREEDHAGGAGAGALVATGIALLAGTLMDRYGFPNLVLMGGDGARAVLSACGAESLTVRGAVQEGVPLGVCNGGRADGTRTVTKAGGFGTSQTLVDIIHSLNATPPTSTSMEAST